MRPTNTTVLFLQNIWREYFGVMHLGAALRAAGHDVHVRIAPTKQQVRRALDDTRPDVVAFSFTQCEQAYALSAAAVVKRDRPTALTVAGGAHPTLHPELALRDEIDLVCRGEGDDAIVALADRVAAREPLDDLPNFALGRDGALVQNPVAPLRTDLDALPPPWREGYYAYPFLRDNPVKFFFTGRGCPYGCTFCFNRSFQSLYPNRERYVRHFGVDRVLEQLHNVRRRWPMRMVRFEDDVFTVDRPRLEALLDRYRREIALPFFCYLRAGETEDVIRRLAEAGCRTALFGIETGDQQRRNQLLGKGVTDAQILETARLVRRHGIHLFTTNMLGLPGETWDDALATLRLNQSLGIKDTWCSVFQPYAGLPITRRAIADGVLDERDVEKVGFNTFGDNPLRNPVGRRIFNLQKFFYVLVRWPRTTRWLLPATKLRPNAVFHYVFVFFYVLGYRQRTGVSLRRLFAEGRHWFRQFLSSMGGG